MIFEVGFLSLILKNSFYRVSEIKDISEYLIIYFTHNKSSKRLSTFFNYLNI